MFRVFLYLPLGCTTYILRSRNTPLGFRTLPVGSDACALRFYNRNFRVWNLYEPLKDYAALFCNGKIEVIGPEILYPKPEPTIKKLRSMIPERKKRGPETPLFIS
jgi:hypothetical protein